MVEVSESFNPRPSLLRGDSAVTLLFQSTPLIAEGRHLPGQRYTAAS